MSASVRLVKPRVFDPYRIEGIAHSTADVVEKIGFHDTLEQALADCVFAVGMTARGRAHKRTLIRPRAAAEQLVERAEEVQRRDQFGQLRLREGRYTPGEIDVSTWREDIEADYQAWLKEQGR